MRLCMCVKGDGVGLNPKSRSGKSLLLDSWLLGSELTYSKKKKKKTISSWMSAPFHSKYYFLLLLLIYNVDCGLPPPSNPAKVIREAENSIQAGIL